MKTNRLLFVMALGWLVLPASVSAFYNPTTGRWLSRDPIGEVGGNNLYAYVQNGPSASSDPLGLKRYDFIKETYYKEIDFQPGDEVIHPEINSLFVGTKLMWPFQEGSGFAKLQCVLANLGFNLPPPKWPIYLANFSGSEMAWSLKYGLFPRKQPTFFDQTAFGSINKHNAAQRAVTLWHEIVGHQINDDNDSDKFNAKYESPIQKAIDALRADIRSSW